MENLKKINKTIRIFLLLNTLFVLAISFMVATEIIFLMERGLNLFEINIVSLVTVIIVFTFEIPTGIIADTYGRKVSFVN